MAKYRTCEQCDAEFKIVQTEKNEELFGKPSFCPFCGTELSFTKQHEFDEEDEEYEE